ncbi:MAG: hypothetical protein MI746_01395 [Pseudomonadales bacterium]|nr:hypothetical protein [Pseudomonadales bacterium]
MSTFFSTIIAAALVNNLFFVQLVGVSPLFAFSRRLKHAIEFASLAGLLLFVACSINLLLYRWILSPLSLEFLSLLLFITVSALVGIGLIKLIEDKFPLTVRRQGYAVALLSISSAVIGSTLISTSSLLSSFQLVIYSLGSAIGFALSLIAFAAIRQRTDNSEAPDFMRGPPLDLITAGIAAMCFLGYAGLV